MTHDRLFNWRLAFDHPATVGMAVGIGGVLAVSLIIILVLSRAGAIGPSLRDELFKRWLSWAIIVPLIAGPVLLGAAWTIGGVAVLSLFCFFEYARATGLASERIIVAAVVAGVLAATFAALDHWYGLFMAVMTLTCVLIPAAGVLADRPEGYIRRTALGVTAFMLFGAALGHLSYMATDRDYRPRILMLLICVELNDVFAFCVGKTLGRHKLAPHTSPNKTIEGSVGALVLTTALAATLGHFVYAGTDLDTPVHLLGLGLIVAAVGQLGDLTFSSIKRDLGIKDMGNLIPGHGGLIDRVNSLILTAPAYFHYVGYFVGHGLDQPRRIMTGE